IVLTGTPAALALKRQTTTIPIILAPIADPIALGLARNLARPGGNVTGVTMYGTELAHKRMEIFKEAAAGIRRVAVLVNNDNPLHPFLWDDVQPIAPYSVWSSACLPSPTSTNFQRCSPPWHEMVSMRWRSFPMRSSSRPGGGSQNWLQCIAFPQCTSRGTL